MKLTYPFRQRDEWKKYGHILGGGSNRYVNFTQMMIENKLSGDEAVVVLGLIHEYDQISHQVNETLLSLNLLQKQTREEISDIIKKYEVPFETKK
jgi:hypothetical protein